MLHSPPHDGVVNREVSVRQGIAHLVGEAPRNACMLSRKCRMMFDDVVAGLANDLNVAYDSVTGFRSAMNASKFMPAA